MSSSGGFPPNPYEHGSPGSNQPLFKSQQPRFPQQQRHSRPRLHQQYIPYHCGPGGQGFRTPHHPGPRPDFISPGGGYQGSPAANRGSPSGSFGGSPNFGASPRFQGSPNDGRFTSPHYKSPQGSSPHYTPYGRGGGSSPNFTPRGRGRGFSSNYTPRGRGRGGFSNRDVNPGGSDDKSLYYCPSMVADPWAGLTPKPLPEY